MNLEKQLRAGQGGTAGNDYARSSHLKLSGGKLVLLDDQTAATRSRQQG